MPIDPVEFNQLKLDLAALTLRVEANEADLDATVTDSIKERVTSLEASLVSIQQVAAMKTSIEQDVAANTLSVVQITAAIQLVNTTIHSLNRWRVDLRHELLWEKAVGDVAKTTWTLPNAYDATSSFMVFQANLTLVDPSLITFTTPTSGVFTSSVALTDDVHVLYMISLDTV